MPATPATPLPPYLDEVKKLGADYATAVRRFKRARKDWEYSLIPEFFGFVAQLPADKRFSVNCSSLNLDIDNPIPTAGGKGGTDGDFLFVRPLPNHKMTELLERTTEWLDPTSQLHPMHYDDDSDDDPDDDSPEDLFAAASILSSRMHGWLTEMMDEEGDTYDNYETWPFMMPKQREYMGGTFTRFQWILDYKEHGDHNLPPSAPHSVAFLAHMLPMDQDYLLAQEVMAFIHLSMHRFLTAHKQGFHVVPVTLISCSGQSVRVLHAFIDEVGRCINVRKSPIFDFTEGLEVNGDGKTPEGSAELRLHNWKKILCWVLAKPDMDSVRALEKYLEGGGDDKRGERGREREDGSPESRHLNTQRGGYDDQRCSPSPTRQDRSPESHSNRHADSQQGASRDQQRFPESSQHADRLVCRGKPRVPE